MHQKLTFLLILLEPDYAVFLGNSAGEKAEAEIVGITTKPFQGSVIAIEVGPVARNSLATSFMVFSSAGGLEAGPSIIDIPGSHYFH
jgi:hypothetical protein